MKLIKIWKFNPILYYKTKLISPINIWTLKKKLSNKPCISPKKKDSIRPAVEHKRSSKQRSLENRGGEISREIIAWFASDYVKRSIVILV